ncbi:MAG: hypothetical protein LLG44_13625, partial [Chloroflexi bacterium]|nr:hypothetical protein [Chloroflexota bacterium]
MKLKPILRIWLPLAVLAVAFALLAYALAQQVLRQNANDPQVQLARDTAAALAEGAQPYTLLPAQVNLSRSLAPFVQVYDAAGRLTAGSGLLDGLPPRIPQGVLEVARAQGENRVTWEPAPGARFAAVVASVQGGDGGFVLAARSLAETEARARHLRELTGLILISILVGTLVVVA